ncbi:DUF1064 domain-containing protein [Aliarcobacter butzleri]|uniref:DUF1064 domain-containing protein n=1 Tax=Aliarcobacter butzleri TaxID=28197 RepID=UPI00215A48CF|nr:DUF1064 domain-containing protein [Aliarcobacter butzleri]MCR8709841.1 DUF1064 domain-containing protein [Aliarcobacter butzleri]
MNINRKIKTNIKMEALRKEIKNMIVCDDNNHPIETFKKQEKKRKYHNKKVLRTLPNGDLVQFDSKKEGLRFDNLLIMARKGLIKNLTLQPEFEIIPQVKHNKKTLCKIKYIADFKYEQNGKIVVEDVKGFKTDVYQLKKRLFLIQNPDLEFREI